MTTTRDQALELANHVRLQRAELKRAIKAGKVSPQEVLRGELPSWLEMMPVGQLVRAVNRLGHKKALRLLSEIQVHESRQLRFVTHRQRHRLAMLLDERDRNLAQRQAYRERAAA